MAGEQQRHHLVADLQVGERVAVLVVGVEQQAEDVLPALAGGAAAGDLRVDQRVELARGPLQTRPRRAGAAQDAQEVLGRVERQRLLEQAGGIDRAGLLAVGIDSEQRAHRHAQGQAAGPGVEVDGGAGRELVERARRLLHDHLDRRGDVLAVEGRQHDHARAAVELAVDREQPVAHQADEVAEVGLAPEEVGGVGDGDVVVGGRPEHEHDVAVEQPQREDRAEALVGLEQHRQRFVGEAARAGQREAGFARRERNGRRALVAQVVEQHRQRA